jgi:hypothetical protein
MEWQLQEAKNKLSELVERAAHNEPLSQLALERSFPGTDQGPPTEY